MGPRIREHGTHVHGNELHSTPFADNPHGDIEHTFPTGQTHAHAIEASASAIQTVETSTGSTSFVDLMSVSGVPVLNFKFNFVLAILESRVAAAGDTGEVRIRDTTNGLDLLPPVQIVGKTGYDIRTLFGLYQPLLPITPATIKVQWRVTGAGMTFFARVRQMAFFNQARGAI